MKIITLIFLFLYVTPLTYGKELVRGDLTVGTLNRYIDVYLEVEGATPIPQNEQLKFVYMCATLQGIIGGVELSDEALSPKQRILERLEHHDLKSVLKDLRGYLSKMKNLDPDANGYNIFVYFLMTKYTENSAVKMKFASMMLKEVTKGKRNAEHGDADQPAITPDSKKK